MPSLPDPRRLPELVETLAGALPRVLNLLGEAEALVRKADALVDRIEQTRTAADEVVARTDAVVTDANALIVRSAGTLGSVEPTLERAQRLLDTFAPVLDDLSPVLKDLVPTITRLAESTDPDEVEALVRLVDQVPLLVDKLQSDIVPIMESMSTVGPDIHAMLAAIGDLADMLEKVPGLNRRRKNAEREAERRSADLGSDEQD